MAKGPGLTEADVAKGIKEAKASGRTVILRDTGRTTGLQVVITAKGTAAWSLLFTPKGEDKPKRLKLGRHAPGFGLVQARLAAGGLREKIARGGDPAVERAAEAAEERARLEDLKAEEARRQAEAEAEARRLTVAQLVELYFASRKGESGMMRARQMVDFSVLPVIGAVAVDALRKADLQRVIDAVAARGNGTQAHRVLEALRPVLRWAIEREYLPAEKDGLWKKLTLPKKGEARDRVLTAREVRWIWDRCSSWLATNANVGRIVQLQLLLGQRSGEICTMARSEISNDLRTWTLPGAKTKNGKPHLVPLPPEARRILGEALEVARADRDEVFVGPRGAAARPDDIAHEVADAITAWNEANPDDAIDPFTPHDFRRTVATRLEETGVAMTVIETTLNHISNKSGSVTRKHYAHGDMSMSVRAALAKWQGLIEICLAGGDPFEVRAEDIDAVEARALAEARGGKANLRVVS